MIINQDSLEQQFKERVDVEVVMQDINKPIGVVEYQLLIPKAELQALVLSEINAPETEDGQD